MGKSLIIIYTTLAIFFLLFLSLNKSPHPKTSHHHRHHRHRRLKIRSNFTLAKPKPPSHKPNLHETIIEHHTTFDPIVAEIERKREDKQWEQHNTQSGQNHAPAGKDEWEGFVDAEDFLNDENRFNMSERLVVLFPNIDVMPVDGFVSEEELTQWHLDQSVNQVMHKTAREMMSHDKNKDGLVSFQEYHYPTGVRQSDSNSSDYEMGWWKERHFNASDADDNGLLNITEFKDFLHPADSTSPKLIKWLCQEEIRETDTNRDGKVDFEEFFDVLYDLLRNYVEEEHHVLHQKDESAESPARKLFAQLDMDKDGYLTDVELLPIIGKLHPSEHFYAQQQAEYAIQQADSDKDGRLTLKEMVDNPYTFYNAILNEDDDKDYDDDDYGYHDEFR